jgi:hypothetical protein
MQPMDTGGTIVGCHDLSKYLLRLGDSTKPGIGYFNVLESEVAVTLFVEAVLRCKAGTLLVSSLRGRMAFQADSKRVFLVGKLVDEVASVTPEREVAGVRGRCVEGGPRAILIVVEQISGIAVTGARGRAQVMERDVRRSPTAARVERNGEGCRLREQPTPMQWIWRRVERRSRVTCRRQVLMWA